MDQFDNISPADYRYRDEEVAKYLSENGFTRYKLDVELALVKVLAKRGICSESVVAEVEAACQEITTEEVYAEEKKTRHDIMALVNCIRRRLSDGAKPFVHRPATSYDIVETANAARYRDVTRNVLVPTLVKLLRTLCDLAEREADTLQIGRTHLQHAVPITFGFALAMHASRLSDSISRYANLADDLVGKFSGAVGAYNASSLLFDDPEDFEEEVCGQMELNPALISSQIVPPEALTRLLQEVVLTAGIMANLCEDMRRLQATEIGEVGEEFEEGQDGSSAMPQKRNPINFENGVSLWKKVMPHIITVYLDQISNHQRDLTNSASARTYPEMIHYTVVVAKRLEKTMRKLKVDRDNLRRNFERQGDLIMAEAWHTLLGILGHPDAHGAVKRLTLRVDRKEFPSLMAAAEQDMDIVPYMLRMKPQQIELLRHPEKYTGIAARTTRESVALFREWLKEEEL